MSHICHSVDSFCEESRIDKMLLIINIERVCEKYKREDTNTGIYLK